MNSDKVLWILEKMHPNNILPYRKYTIFQDNQTLFRYKVFCIIYSVKWVDSMLSFIENEGLL